MRVLTLTAVILTLSSGPLFAHIGDPVAAFANGPLVQQLSLSPAGTGDGGTSRIAYRYISDDQTITVDLIANGGTIEQQVMYVPPSIQRGYQVSFFLQDAIGSIFGSQQGMLAFNAALSNHTETSMAFGGYTMLFTPMGSVLRVMVSRS
jgi:hypothetical protein